MCFKYFNGQCTGASPSLCTYNLEKKKGKKKRKEKGEKRNRKEKRKKINKLELRFIPST